MGNFLVLSLLTLVDVSLVIRLGFCKSVANIVFVHPSSPWERQSLVRGLFCTTKVTAESHVRATDTQTDTRPCPPPSLSLSGGCRRGGRGGRGGQPGGGCAWKGAVTGTERSARAPPADRTGTRSSGNRPTRGPLTERFTCAHIQTHTHTEGSFCAGDPGEAGTETHGAFRKDPGQTHLWASSFCFSNSMTLRSCSFCFSSSASMDFCFWSCCLLCVSLNSYKNQETGNT